MSEELKKNIEDVKDFQKRKYNSLTDNFYLVKAAIRYFAVKNGLSFTTQKISESFPLSIPAAGASLTVLEELEVIESRTDSGSPNRYMPQKVDMERLEEVEKILLENYEIEEF